MRTDALEHHVGNKIPTGCHAVFLQPASFGGRAMSVLLSDGIDGALRAAMNTGVGAAGGPGGAMSKGLFAESALTLLRDSSAACEALRLCDRRAVVVV